MVYLTHVRVKSTILCMGARQKKSVERSPSSDSRMTYTEFLHRFPDNDACLDYLKERFYPNGTPCPKCGKPSRFHRIRSRSAYSCQFCGTTSTRQLARS